MLVRGMFEVYYDTETVLGIWNHGLGNSWGPYGRLAVGAEVWHVDDSVWSRSGTLQQYPKGPEFPTMEFVGFLH